MDDSKKLTDAVDRLTKVIEQSNRIKMAQLRDERMARHNEQLRNSNKVTEQIRADIRPHG